MKKLNILEIMDSISFTDLKGPDRLKKLDKRIQEIKQQYMNARDDFTKKAALRKLEDLNKVKQEILNEKDTNS